MAHVGSAFVAFRNRHFEFEYYLIKKNYVFLCIVSFLKMNWNKGIAKKKEIRSCEKHG